MLSIAWLKEQRLKLGLTMQDIGDEMFVTKQAIHDLEYGKTHKKLMLVTYERVILEHLKEDYQI
jgi:transcriptional regulator with XRE-family HTH domain